MGQFIWPFGTRDLVGWVKVIQTYTPNGNQLGTMSNWNGSHPECSGGIMVIMIDASLWSMHRDLQRQTVQLWAKCIQFCCPCCTTVVNSSPPGQNGHHLADNIFRYIFMNEKLCIWIKISLKFVLKGPIDNDLALVQIMAWRRPGDKPLSEPMMVSSLTHICVTRPQWVNAFTISC